MQQISVRPLSEAGALQNYVDVAIIGAGACGLTAALAARDAGASVCVFEQDEHASGTTAMTWGMVPGAGTRFQRERGIEDTPEDYIADIMKKSANRADPSIVRTVAYGSGPAVEWLADQHGIPFLLLDDVLYPGHGRHRYHVPPSRTGAELQQRLVDAAQQAGAQFQYRSRVTTLYQRDDQSMGAVGGHYDDGTEFLVACGAIVLATGGYGANPEAIRTHITEMAQAAYCGHDGSRGDALEWGHLLDASTGDLSGYQGHCVVDGSQSPLTWTLIIEGGIQVNHAGQRFSNEMSGYSEQASALLRQEGGTAYTVYDERSERLALRYADYERVRQSGAIVQAETVDALADAMGVSRAALTDTLHTIEQSAQNGIPDAFGRKFDVEQLLRPPFRAVKLRGALFHTQGGLCVDGHARLINNVDTKPLLNVFAGGGAARGISGPDASGYLGGNGLVTAIVLGRLAGQSAAVTVQTFSGDKDV
jgi:fumarate reductase flavoprotein subunit